MADRFFTFCVLVASLSYLQQTEAQISANGDHSLDFLQGGLNEITPAKFFRKMKKLVAKTNKSKSVLGQMCFDSSDCSEIGSGRGVECARDHTCQCDRYHIQVDQALCLPGVLLGFSCEDSTQCNLKVSNSVCVQGYCRCEIGYTPYGRGNCLQGSHLGSTCRSDEQCKMANENSECKWIVMRVLGRCQCRSGMPRRGTQCSPPGYALGAPCGKTLECAQNIPGSICVEPTKDVLEFEGPVETKLNGISSRHKLGTNFVLKNSIQESPAGLKIYGGICLCPKGHLAVENNTKCVPIQKDASEPSVSLGKACRTDSQCKGSDPFSVCQDQICTCAERTSECSHQNRGCFNGTFQCVSDGRCISGDFVCNKHIDCKDGSDETDCVPGRCPPIAFACTDGSCISRDKVCDSRLDCKDGSDEVDCFLECPTSTFRCNDGQCLPGYSFCNAHYDCIDKSDENAEPCIQGALHVPQCPFRCRNQLCRSRSILCSGIDGCGDGSDEEKCFVCNCPKPNN